MQSKSLRVLLAGSTILILAVGAAQAQSKAAPKAAVAPAPAPAPASSSSSSSFPRFSVGANLGAAEGPNAGTFDLGFEAPVEFNNNWAVGPWMQIGLAEDFVDLFVTLNTRYTFDLFDGPKTRKLRPYLQGGPGLAYSRLKPFSGETDFLINMGIGAEYAVSDHFLVGSDVMVNTIPTTSPAAAVAVSWQFARLRYRF